MTPEEILVRQRFTTDLQMGYSVIAPAGSGKTRAIIDRVKNLLLKTQKSIALVTYTNKAAEEMRVRLDREMVGNPYNRDRLFVGTIHSLCGDLLRRFGPMWGLPTPFETVPDLSTLLADFQNDIPNPLEPLGESVVRIFEKHFDFFDLDLLGKTSPRLAQSKEITQPPSLPLEQVPWSEKPKRKAAEYYRLQDWIRRYLETGGWNGPLKPPSRPEGTTAQELYDAVFSAYESWKSKTGLLFAQTFAYAFRSWRLQKGRLGYDDMITIVAEKIEEGENLTVILDEAQDTSADQLTLLQKLAHKHNNHLDFTMVGDPQQSIYSSRASLAFYQKTHQTLVNNHGVVPLTFKTTFRCDHEIVDLVNALGPNLLDGRDGQAEFVKLTASDNAKKGSLGRWIIPEGYLEEKAADTHFAEASYIARKLKEEVKDFSCAHEIAILAPRKTESWLQTLATALQHEGIACQLHSKTNEASPAGRLLRACAHLITHPYDRFELVGLLREIFPLADKELSFWIKKSPELFNISLAPEGELPSELNEALFLLNQAWLAARAAPTYRALDVFCAKLSLRERLLSLEGLIGDNLAEDFDRSKTAINARIGGASTLAEAYNSSESAPEPVKEGHIQLMTIHKAKGLEWDVVILPYFFRKISSKPSTLPFLDTSKTTSTLVVSKTQWDKNSSTLKEIQELKRLMYVALTRARKGLLFIDDSALYQKPPKVDKAKETDEEKIIIPSSAELCGFLAPHQHLWQQIPHHFNFPSSLSSTRQIIDVDVRQGLPLRLAQTITPSSRSVAPAEHTHRAEGGSTYGSYWHDLFATATSAEGLEDYLRSQIPSFPKPERANIELEKLFSSPLWALLQKHPFWTEVPLLCKLPEGVVEGRLDLVIQTPSGLLLVDWKTDHLPLPMLYTTYAPQLQIYRQGLEFLEKSPVLATLYATVSGDWLACEGETFRLIKDQPFP